MSFAWPLGRHQDMTPSHETGSTTKNFGDFIHPKNRHSSNDLSTVQSSILLGTRLRNAHSSKNLLENLSPQVVRRRKMLPNLGTRSQTLMELPDKILSIETDNALDYRNGVVEHQTSETTTTEQNLPKLKVMKKASNYSRATKKAKRV